jgi:hypothetical protein
LTWNLVSWPAGAAINTTNGLIAWRPTISQAPSTNHFTVRVSDSGNPMMAATQSFAVVVLRPSIPFLSSPAYANGQFQFTISGNTGPDYSIYVTTNLSLGWQLLLATNPPAFPFLFTDPAAANSPSRYYRLQLGP